MDDDLRLDILGQAMVSAEPGKGGKPPGKKDRYAGQTSLISLAKQQFLGPEDDLAGLTDGADTQSLPELGCRVSGPMRPSVH